MTHQHAPIPSRVRMSDQDIIFQDRMIIIHVQILSPSFRKLDVQSHLLQQLLPSSYHLPYLSFRTTCRCPDRFAIFLLFFRFFYQICSCPISRMLVFTNVSFFHLLLIDLSTPSLFCLCFPRQSKLQFLSFLFCRQIFFWSEACLPLSYQN